MITNKNETQSVNGQYVSPESLYGLSTDTKPVNVANGSLFTEIDTGKKFLFDYTGGEWYEQPEDSGGGGGGGGGAGGGALVVNVDTSTGALDKTWQEIYDAFPAVEIYYTEEDEEDGADYQAAFRLIVVSIEHDEFVTSKPKYSLIARDPMSSATMEEVLFGAATASDYPTSNYF